MARRLRIGCALAAMATFGCNSIAGINEPKDKDPGSSSGASGGPSSTNVQPFVGTWSTTSGAQVLTCPGGEKSGDSLALSLVLSAGTTPGTIIVSPKVDGVVNTSCTILCSVQGDTASVLLTPAQTCVFSSASERDTYTYIEPTTFVLSADATQAELHINATIFVEPPGGTCTFKESGTFTKESP